MVSLALVQLWLNVLNVTVKAMLCKHVTNAMEMDRYIAMIAMELVMKNVLGAMEEVGKNVSLALAQVEKTVFRALEMDMTLMETNAICVEGKGIKIVLCAMALVLIDVIIAWEMAMKTVLIVMALEL